MAKIQDTQLAKIRLVAGARSVAAGLILAIDDEFVKTRIHDKVSHITPASPVMVIHKAISEMALIAQFYS